MRLISAFSVVAVLTACGHVDVVDEPDDESAVSSQEVIAALSRLEAGTVIVATGNVNLRSGPAKTFPVVDVVASGQRATVLRTSTENYLEVSLSGTRGWTHRAYYDVVSRPGNAATTLAAIDTAAASSACFRYQWANRGQMPRGFIKGVARDFARSVCEPTRADVVVASRARTSDSTSDALAWFNGTFTAAGMTNDRAGVDTLRHVYVLLLGLGMRESSGEHCVGRDASASNVSSESAEAGAWQTSYDSRGAHPQLVTLFNAFRSDSSHCQRATFAEGVTCSAANWKNWGTGADGLLFQKLEKECPAFAAEYAAVMLRVNGGSRGHYGPLRTRAAEVRPECDSMLKTVQRLVETDASVCGAL